MALVRPQSEHPTESRRRLPIRAKLAVVFGLLLVPLLVMGGTTMFLLRDGDSRTQALVQELIEEATLRSEGTRMLAEAEEAVTLAVESDDAEARAHFNELAAGLETTFRRSRSLDEGEERQPLAQAEASWRRSEVLARAAMSGAGDTEVPDAFWFQMDRAQAELAQLATESHTESWAEVRALENRQRLAQNVLAALLIAAGLLAVVAGHTLHRSIVKRLRLLEDATTRVAEDDLDVRLPEENDELGRVASSFNAMAERLAAARVELAHQAFHDPLTDLANRALFLDRVDHAIQRAQRSGNALAVLYIDLDEFKTVNDSLGHSSGDALLAAVARRLENSLRPSDTIARLGGDEFAVLIEDIEDSSDAARAAQRVLSGLEQPLQIGDAAFVVTASVGIASGGAGEEDAVGVLRNADLAMYSSKQAGPGNYTMFEPEMHSNALERLALEADLRRAIDRDEFELRYQPILDLQTGTVTALEALVRWQHPEQGEIQPAAFIPAAEKSGLIVPLGRWVLDEACRAGVQFQAHLNGSGPLGICVNLSPKQFTSSTLVSDVRRALSSSGLNPDALTLEITEGVLVEDVDGVIAMLDSLRALGVRIALDDFGTGYASLSYLRRLPIDVLKVDKSFVDDVRRSDHAWIFTDEIVRFGRRLGLQTLAEGIEEPEQLTALQKSGCELGQGFLFARPLAARDVPGFLIENRPPGELLEAAPGITA